MAACVRHADEPALDFLGKKTTYAELGRAIDALTGAFQKELGIEKGTRVAILLPNSPYFAFAYYAVMRAGGITVSCNPLFTTDELGYIIGHSGAKVLITVDVKQVFEKAEALHQKGIVDKLVVARFSDALPGLKSVLFRLFKRADIANVQGSPAAGAVIPLNDLITANHKPEPVKNEPDDIAAQQYTGGTTGFPKGALLSHRNIAANASQTDLYGIDVFKPPFSIVAILPFFHIFGMTICLNVPLSAGGQVVMMPRFDMKGFLDLVARTRPKILPSVPTLLHAIATSPLTKNYDLSSIVLSISGGAPLANETRDLFAKVCGATLAEGYGLTETSPVLSCAGLRSPSRRNSIGMPLPGTEIRFADLDNPGVEVPQGTSGELQARGPQVMKSYFNNDKATKEAFVDGWFRTGDVGYIDEDGYIFLVDRIKDIVIVNGYNVYPHDVETVMRKHSAVDECTVIGVPDTRKGEIPIVYVKLTKPGIATIEQLTEFARENLSRLQYPREIFIRDQLPKTLIGKLTKKELVEEYLATHGESQ
jgi:long-chain acyl-CoA synthetase